MPNPTGFLEIGRCEPEHAAVTARVRNYHEFLIPLPLEETKKQAERCMGCGIPYCHSACPVNNQIPDWNELVSTRQFRKALDDLHTTNNFPEITGRICPAPCEEACTLNLNDEPVTIKGIECAIIDRGFTEGWVLPEQASIKTDKAVAIIGSGPAGLACAQQLARAGHEVHVFEKNAKAGGLLRYGIPDFKLEKRLIDRRVAQMSAEGVVFHYGVHVGVDVPADEILNRYDAVVLAGGVEEARDLSIPGRDLKGIHFAMDFLAQQNRRVAGEPQLQGDPIVAMGKRVVVIGGGDTGSDCVGTAIRQGATSTNNLELLPRPPEAPNKLLSWPNWPLKMRTSSSHEEGATRDFSILTQGFSGEQGHVRVLHCVQVSDDARPLTGTEFEIRADLVLIAAGFSNPVREGLLESLRVELDQRGNVRADAMDYHTSRPAVFVAGDMRRGQSLVVWAIREGRRAARAVDTYLMGITDLPT